MQLGPLPKDQFDRILKDMDTNGYAVLPNAFSPDEIAEARSFVERETDKRKGEYFSFVGREPVAGTLLQRVGDSTPFRTLMADLSSNVMGRSVAPGAPLQVLRVVAGQSGGGQSMLFHYDAYAMTAVVPIAIPKEPGQPCGDLVLYANLRPIRSNVIFNVIEKTFMQNSLAQKIMSTSLMQKIFKAKVLRIDPGNVYFFKGYQSLHANEPCHPSALRATALFHFGDPHEDSSVTEFIKRIRHRYEARKARALAN
ncbi:hypothetical protein [Methylocapsa palsarum]|uniref:Phytanoyl-CoA dioxygenase (PhyH) n=1 Tax=Methylocapsa palsarum TaxID=1612308 RepID=A0A1I4B3A7_9HYPH|nr:hypothetical protein [Methylocapsa palsarum]SFK62366.1 hypothetical protein SAMN05444581_11282 [Methylocapsa palsarum]